MDRFLQEARQAGTESSSGQITLNVLKAKKKLGTHQLQAPHEYVLPLVSAAVLSKPTFVNFSGTFQNLQVEFDGDPFHKDDFVHALGAHTGRGAELALFLRAVQTLAPRTVRVVSGLNNEVHTLQVTDGRPEVWSNREEPLPYTRVEVSGAELGQSGKELKNLLATRCRFNPTIAYNGKRVHIPKLVNSCGVLRLQGKGAENPAASVSAWVAVTKHTENLSGQVWLTEGREHHLTFVRHGVAYPKIVTLPTLHGLRGVVACPELSLDISRSGVVEDDTLTDILKLLVAEIAGSLYPRVLREYRTLMPSDKSIARHHLTRWRAYCDPETKKRIERKLQLV